MARAIDILLVEDDPADAELTLRADPATRHLPIIIFTSSAEPRDLNGSYGCGANAYAQKPVNFDAFGDTLRRVCEFWLGVNQTPGASR